MQTYPRMIDDVPLHADRLQSLQQVGNDPLVTQSWPYAGLTACPRSNGRPFAKIAQLFDLVLDPSDHANMIHLRSRVLAPGRHKQQAIRLFLVGIALLCEKAARNVFLYEVSQLHCHMAERLGINALPYHPDGIVEQWSLHPHYYSVSQPIYLHLTQAGFELPTQGRRLDLAPSDVDSIRRTLMQESRQCPKPNQPLPLAS